MRFAHFTTAHPRGDTRIRVKQIATLSAALSGEVLLIVQDGEGSEQDNSRSFQVIDTLRGGKRGRIRRMTIGAAHMWWAVRKANPLIAHVHDPELIPVGLALKLSGIRVIYDVHEDLPRQILGKHWIKPWLRRTMAWLAEQFERLAGHVFDGIVAATPTITRRFPANKTVTVQNYPIQSELIAPKAVEYNERPLDFAYIGGITSRRGAREMLAAVGLLDNDECKIQLAGGFQPASLQTDLQNSPEWRRVCYHGWARRPQVAALLGNVRGGLVVLHPTENYPDAYPVKMFEYMAAGLPVIASDFPLWRKIVDGAGCGLLVDPLDPCAISEAMRWLIDHPVEAEAMGKRGREAVEQTYNWESESKKLISLYERLLGNEARKNYNL